MYSVAMSSLFTRKKILIIEQCKDSVYFNKKKKIIILKEPTTVQICRLENKEHKSMKQVSKA